jgi:hypothetical protein
MHRVREWITCASEMQRYEKTERTIFEQKLAPNKRRNCIQKINNTTTLELENQGTFYVK